MKTYDSKEQLIKHRSGTLFLVEQPHGLTAYDFNEREPRKIKVDGKTCHDLLTIDMQTSRCIDVIVSNLSEANRHTMLSWSWASIGRVAWELYGKCKK